MINDVIQEDAFYRPVGQIMVEECENNLIAGQFVPGPAFETLEKLFLSFEEAVDAQAFSVVDELDAQIAALGLRLHWPSEIQPTQIEDVQIWSDGEITCRLCHEVPSLSLNGSQELPVRVPSYA